MRLQDKIAIVTGAASGIGAASADLFAAEGAHVLAVDRAPISLTGREGVQSLIVDVTEDGAAETIVNAALDRFGRLDILFNNAGVGGAAPLEETTDAAFDRVLDVNLRAVFRLCRTAAPHLKRSAAGRIISTASVMAEGADFGLYAYCASKAGVVGMTRVLALELGRFGVTANAILPGAIQTGMTRASFENEDIARVWARKSPLKRLGQPIDIARAALFLASDESAFITGQAVAVDGGLRLRV